ncbi:carbohydrate ABC transporter permease [Spirilliplanes yamanashiensis]|uniref:Sugar ABC transporter permease n=1 Tax=Spirilliplanes yamanashiensis TaxID=42233 RepID=A0A8J3Y9J6_9ACTN|nr:sugar ABC transporter permease [Spirilliplanes yamanashiensis]MDP9815610.1 multiple sugar transport system permease protein [Spirilliplanes yamanashiensis]GIJ03864.1 sugar ABC transporter permease [Spirilliplanes yamanashiensis]
MALLTADKPRTTRTTEPGDGPGTQGRLRRRIQDNLLAYAFLAGGILCFALFSWYPLVRGVILSFQQVNFVTDPYWVGAENFEVLFDDPLFWTAWKNTVVFTGLALVLGYAAPLVLAILLNELRHFKAFFRIAVYLPVMLPPIVVVLLWKYFYDPGNGLFNAVLRGVGLPESQWTQGSGSAMISLVLVSTWANLGGATLMYLAALQGIPGELYEAAELDGASVWQRLRHVTLPQLRFIMLVLLLLQVIATMQVFIEPFQLTGTSNPDTITVMVLIYRYAFTVNQDFGLAAAMSVLLFVVLGVFSAIYLRLTREAQ